MIVATLVQRRICQLYCSGLIPYRIAWNWQQLLVQARREHPTLDDVLIVLEHPPVYTLGRGASLDFIKFDVENSSYDLFRVERGGEVTYHCPGQLVAYPILNLHFYRKDLHWYLRQLEEVIIHTLAQYGLAGDRLDGLTGVWLDGRKVAAIGINVSRWVTMHGFSLNVCPDLNGFQNIVPCGIADKPVGSLEHYMPGITVNEVRSQLVRSFAEIFNVELVTEGNNPTLLPTRERTNNQQTDGI
ncbi:MAG: lipoyl(octanoyl) transferase LipB [Elainellaceae cyanobacterium]